MEEICSHAAKDVLYSSLKCILNKAISNQGMQLKFMASVGYLLLTMKPCFPMATMYFSLLFLCMILKHTGLCWRQLYTFNIAL